MTILEDIDIVGAALNSAGQCEIGFTLGTLALDEPQLKGACQRIAEAFDTGVLAHFHLRLQLYSQALAEKLTANENRT